MNKFKLGVYKPLFLCYNNYMKQKFKIIDKVTGKTLEKEVEIRNQDHFNVQLKTKAHVFKNHKKYTRKLKHKKKDEE